MDPKVLIVLANVAAAALGGLAASNAFPHLTPVFSAVAGLLAGWVNVHKPQKKEEAK